MKTLLIILLAFILINIEGKVFKEEYTFSTLRRSKGWTFLDRMKIG
jgi:hypothetical protein